MKHLDPAVCFGFFCVGLVLLTLAWMLVDALATALLGGDDLLDAPHPTCERDIAKHWRVGMSSSGWRK